MTTMTAFHGDIAIKGKYLTRVRMHREADNLIRGTSWDGHRGCAIGCTLEKYDHAAYETELGIPRALARLEDGLFESLPIDLAMQWPERFLSAIRPGADLSLVMSRFFAWLLIDPQDGVIKFAKNDRTRKSIQDVGDLYARKASGGDVTAEEFKKSAYAADAAAAAAYAADAAADAADAADAAADAAAYAADAADAAAARSQARVRQADKLIELLESA